MRAKGRLAAGIAVALATCATLIRVDPDPEECTTANVMARVAPDTTDALQLMLNVPAYRLDVIELGTVTRSIVVAVGQPKYRTPLGHFQVDYAVWNPWWRPPASEWARNERPKAPGRDNPVGRVKLHVTGLVFLHGTPLEGSLGTAASHACVRMSNTDAIALARLVHAIAGPSLSREMLDTLVADTTRTRTITLTRTVPIDIVYELAEIRAHELVLYPDIYRRASSRSGSVESHAVAALLRAGIDTAGLRVDRLRDLAKTSHRGEARIAVDSLLSTPLTSTPRAASAGSWR